VDIVLVGIGGVDSGRSAADTAAALIDAGAGTAQPWLVAGTPAAVDEPLEHLDGRRLVIDADLAGLQLILSRLLRKGLLESVETAVLPRDRVGYLDRIGMPRRPADQIRVAVQGRPRLIGVVKDDSGGLCVEHATVSPWPNRPDRVTTGTPTRPGVSRSGWWLRAVVDDQLLCDGEAHAVSLRRLGPEELEATVRLGRWRTKTLHGRSLQLACDEASITQDGVGRERPRGKRTFWSEPKSWQLCL
jgi:hypothetical protein